jgi:hypothetical protein
MKRSILLLVIVSVFALTLLIPSLSKASSSQVLSTVTFEFDGMMGLFMGSSEKVTLGLLNAHHHTPEMAIYKLIGGEKREVARFRGDQLKRTINIWVTGSTQRPFQYLAMEGREKDEQDFRWTLDIEGELYKRKLKIKEDSFFAKVHFKSGVFYSKSLSEYRTKFTSEDGRVLPFDRQVGTPASKIDLTSGQALVIQGLEEPITLNAQSGTSYFVDLTNLPPQEMMSIEHFEFYYESIDEQLPKYTPFIAEKSFFKASSFCTPLIFSLSGLN